MPKVFRNFVSAFDVCFQAMRMSIELRAMLFISVASVKHSCKASNFASRVECFSCKTAKPDTFGSGDFGDSRSPSGGKPGDWDCPKYGNVK